MNIGTQYMNTWRDEYMHRLYISICGERMKQMHKKLI